MNELALRCTCRARPLLAVCRPTSTGRMILHVRAYKRGQLLSEIVAEDGTVRIRCRACLRWYVVHIKREHIDHHPERLPESINVPAL